MKTLLDQLENYSYREYLYPRGYLITDKKAINIARYPYYDNWNCVTIKRFNIYVHKKQKCYVYQSEDKVYFIIGHCYNPFTMEYDEINILKTIAMSENQQAYFEYLNQLTGNFVIGYEDGNGDLFFTCDATGMMAAFYGKVKEHFYVSNYCHLIGDICHLEFDPYIKELISYRWYGLFGKMLPGDLSSYKEIKHIIPNFQITLRKGIIEKFRFWPVEPINTEVMEDAYHKKIEECASILHNSMDMIRQKWPGKAAISMTGGCDSKTTLACANGLYDEFKYFSYTSSESELVDAEAAKKICNLLGLEHHTYQISDQDSDFKDIELIRAILRRNCGEIGDNNLNDVRKRAFFLEHHDFDVEVKSWVSEVVRAYYNKRFHRRNFPKYPTPRYLTAMYKVFFLERGLVRKTDKVFRKFLWEYYSKDIFDKVSWTDLIFWEYRVSSWNGLVISNEHSLSFDITIPYNNRILLKKLLETPLEKRMEDQCHKDIQKLMNPQIAETGISITNLKHTENRAKLEKLYLLVQTKTPF